MITVIHTILIAGITAVYLSSGVFNSGFFFADFMQAAAPREI